MKFTAKTWALLTLTLLSLALVAGAGSYYWYRSVEDSTSSDPSVWLAKVRDANAALVDNDAVWARTLTYDDVFGLNRETFSCLVNRTDCRGQGGAFYLVGEKSVVFAHSPGFRAPAHSDPMNPGAGFAKNGRVCWLFSNGFNPRCPIRYELSWRPLCADHSPCIDPEIEVVGRLVMANSVNAKRLKLSEEALSFVKKRPFLSLQGRSVESFKCAVGQIAMGFGTSVNKRNCVTRQSEFKFDGVRAVALQNIDLSSITIKSSSFRNSSFLKSTLRGAYIRDSKFESTTFHGVDFRGASIEHSTFDRCDFRGADLRGVSFDNVRFTRSYYDLTTKLPFDPGEAKRLGLEFLQ